MRTTRVLQNRDTPTLISLVRGHARNEKEVEKLLIHWSCLGIPWNFDSVFPQSWVSLLGDNEG
jgi:hypothetical protein